MVKSKKPVDTTAKSARRARGLVRVEVWIDPVIAGALDALGVIRNETRAQTLRAAVLLLFQMQATGAQLGAPPTIPLIKRCEVCGESVSHSPTGLPLAAHRKTARCRNAALNRPHFDDAGRIITDAMARGVSSGLVNALGTNGREASKSQPSKGKCKRCGFVACACLGGVKR